MNSQFTGMEIARAMAEHEGTAMAWNHQILEVDSNRAVVSLKIVETMTNGLGLVHGGIVFALADTALAYVACAQNVAHVTTTATINFLASAKLDDTLTATAVAVARVGRSTAIDVKVVRGDNQIIATVHGISRSVTGSVLEALVSTSSGAQPR